MKRLALLSFLAVLLLALSAPYGLPCGGHGQQQGPPQCAQTSGPGGAGGGGGSGSGCTTCSGPTKVGAPADAVATFTGDLYIQDTPVSYQTVGDGFAFTMTYNADTALSTPLGYGWNFSSNPIILNDAPNGALVAEGNGWNRYFTGDPTSADPYYDQPAGVFVKLRKLFNGRGAHIGWILSRPTGSQMHFDINGWLTDSTDSQGFTWHFYYTGNLLTSITDPLNRQTTLSYTNGYLTLITVPGGAHAHFGYDNHSPKRLTSVTDAADYTYTYGYDASDRIDSLVDPSGREIDYTYDASGRVSTICTNGLAASLKEYTYTPQTDGKLWVDLTEMKDGVDRITRDVYENTDDVANGRYIGTLLSHTVDPGGPAHVAATTAYSYDSQHRTVRKRDSYDTETGGKAHRHFYYYTDVTNPQLVTKYIDPENSDASPTESGTPTANCPGALYEYDARGNKTKETTPEGRVTDYTYEVNSNRLSSVIVRDQDVNGNPVDRTTSYTYYTNAAETHRYHQLHTMTDGRGNVTHYDYDTTTGYLTVVTPQEGGATTYGYNSVGDVTSVQDGNGTTTSYQYDGIHRLTQVTYPDLGVGQKTKTTVWACCGKTQETDENGVITKYYYEEDKPTPLHTHRLWKVVQDYGTGKLNYTTEYSYDEVGNAKTVKNPRGYTTAYTYDAASRKVQADYPDSTHEYWTLRDDGRLYAHTDGRGRVITYRYDADDRPCGPYIGGSKAIEYPNDTDVYITRDRDGLVTETRDASGTTTNVYYPSQRLRSSAVSIGGTAKTVTYDYNGVGLVSSMQVTGESAFSYSYNGRNQLSSVTNPNSVQVSFTYDNEGRRTRITEPGGYVEYVYNARDWITEVRNRTTGGVTRYDATYYYQDGTQWDHAGNPLKRVENLAGSTYTTTLRYDRVYRQTEETKKNSGGSTLYSLLYGYDACGNRTSRTVGGVATSYSYDNNNKLTNVNSVLSCGYDGNGNLTSTYGNLPSQTMVYNDQNYLTSVTYGGATDSYYYTYGGRRYRATLGGITYSYLYNGTRVLEEWDDAGTTMSARYTTEDDSYGGALLHLYRPTGSLSRFPMYDSIGSVRGLVDASGTVTDTYELDTFGKPVSSTGTTPNPYRYGGAWGYISDPSGMLQLGARYYWPEVARFVQQDPARSEMNPYSYCSANPGVSVDPDGLWTRCWRVAGGSRELSRRLYWGPWHQVTCSATVGWYATVGKEFIVRFRTQWLDITTKFWEVRLCVRVTYIPCFPPTLNTWYTRIESVGTDHIPVGNEHTGGFGGWLWGGQSTPGAGFTCKVDY